jgi:hypothetical protein
MRLIKRIDVGEPRSLFLENKNREIGAQIKPWSCREASLEYLSYFKIGNNNPIYLQENVSLSQKSDWTKIIPDFHMRPHDEPNVIDAKTNAEEIYGKIAPYLEIKTFHVAFIINAEKFRNQGKHTVAIDKATKDYCRIVIPNGNNLVEPDWGDFKWMSIVEWVSKIHVLRSV